MSTESFAHAQAELRARVESWRGPLPYIGQGVLLFATWAAVKLLMGRPQTGELPLRVAFAAAVPLMAYLMRRRYRARVARLHTPEQLLAFHRQQVVDELRNCRVARLLVVGLPLLSLLAFAVALPAATAVRLCGLLTAIYLPLFGSMLWWLRDEARQLRAELQRLQA